MKQLLMLGILLIAVVYTNAQDSIVVTKDPRLDIFNAKQAAVNRLASHLNANGQFKGFRLQVLSTRSRDEAFKVKASLLQQFPGQKTYALYQSPYFKIRIGDFAEREAAEKFRTSVLRYYPQGVYVVDDVIDYNPEETDETTE
ncbi:SPOR domain-containing protein [Deminuibacter soli]|nr:SPOR domain-containing protein [Deminuibacter soli]